MRRWMERAGRSLSLGNSQLYRPITDGERNLVKKHVKANPKNSRDREVQFSIGHGCCMWTKKKRGRERERGGERERELRRLSNYQLNSPFTDSRRYRVSPWTSFIRADIPTMLCFFVGQILLDTAYTERGFHYYFYLSLFFLPFLSFLFFSITIF